MKEQDTTVMSRLSAELLTQFSDFVAEHMCLYFPPDRWPELMRGARAAASASGHASVEEYVRWLLSAQLTQAQIEGLASHLTVGETYFFRGKSTFDVLAAEILPELVRARRGSNQRLHIWSVGCCTGEEAYSLGILVSRAIPDLQDWHVTILATDINRKFLHKAEAGVFGAWSFRDPPPMLKELYFTPKAEGLYEIAPFVRKMVVFRPLNLAADVYPSLLNDTNAMDVILCRNVLMYFTPEQAGNVIRKLHHCLVDGGWLVVGPNETSSARIRSRSPMQRAARIVGSCARQAPFGLPVVPEV